MRKNNQMTLEKKSNMSFVDYRNLEQASMPVERLKTK